MLVAVMGGRLQGVEAAYLSKKAGWSVVLVDRNSNAPAAGICDHFLKFDFMEKDKLIRLFKEVQFVIPAIENETALQNINQCALEAGVKICYDPSAYAFSSSKINSDRLFVEVGIPVPKPWPFCGFPVTLKPSGASGSKNVYRVNNLQDFNKLIVKLGNLDDWVKQEYLQGTSYSIEVIGFNGDYRTFQITELEMDAIYDCKRVLAPAELSREKEYEFRDYAVKISRAINLNGIMDVEVILHDEKLKVLEIDARLPSQTPTVVYKSTGINLLEVLWSGWSVKNEKKKFESKTRGVIYEHIKVTGKRIEVGGEHMMSDAGHLHLYENFFGAEEAISNFSKDKEEWVATLISTGEDRDEAWLKRCLVINNIIQKYGLNDYLDSCILENNKP